MTNIFGNSKTLLCFLDPIHVYEKIYLQFLFIYSINKLLVSNVIVQIIIGSAKKKYNFRT